MIGYVTLGTNDREKSAKFYDAFCGELGAGRMMENEQFIAWGKPAGGAGLGLPSRLTAMRRRSATASWSRSKRRTRIRSSALRYRARSMAGPTKARPAIAGAASMPAISAILTATS